MYKISWARKSDRFARQFVLAPDVHALLAIHWIITGYGRNDGASPVDIKVTDLDGNEVDMTKGLADAAGQGTYGSRS